MFKDQLTKDHLINIQQFGWKDAVYYVKRLFKGPEEHISGFVFDCKQGAFNSILEAK